MTAEQIIFLLTGALILGSALMVVTVRNLLHAALWLVAALFGVAVLYAILQASFLAVVQVVVYIGAIAILFIFAVMLTRRELMDKGRQTRSNWWIPALLGLLILAGLVLLILSVPGVDRTAAGHARRAWIRSGRSARHWSPRMPTCCPSKWLRSCCWRRWWARSMLRPSDKK